MSGSEIRNYRDLVVWQRGRELASACYRQTRSFPRSEIYGMTSQIRRAATSVPANIAEGNGRESTGAYIASLRIAQGSLKELETLLIVSQDVELIEQAEAEHLLGMCESIGKPLRALIRSLQQKVEK